MQRDKELEVNQVAVEMEKKLWVDIKGLENARYDIYEKVFDEDLAQIKHFNNSASVDLLKVDRGRKLEEILAQGASDYQGAPTVLAGLVVYLKEEGEEKESSTYYPNLS